MNDKLKEALAHDDETIARAKAGIEAYNNTVAKTRKQRYLFKFKLTDLLILLVATSVILFRI